MREFDLTDDGWLVPQLGTIDWVQPPPELHLREFRNVDPSDPEGLRDLCQVVGEVVDDARPWMGIVGERVLSELKPGLAEQFADHIGDQLELHPAEWDERRPGGDHAGHVHVREVACRVQVVRVLVSHAQLFLDGKRTSPLWQQLGAFEDDEMTAHDERVALALGEKPLADENPETVAWARFSGYLNQGLVEFSPRVLGQFIESEPDLSDVVTSFGAASAMVFNDLRDRIPYRHCADETCGRLFRRQLGRAKGVNKPRSSGVEFCTWAHARNQSRRERRRAERQAEGDE